MNLKERMVNISRLTQNQQKVMAKILAAPTPLVAFSEISSGPNLIAARDILQKLGLIDFKEDESAEVTDTGMQILRSLNIVDDMDELTDEGRNMAYDQEQQPGTPVPEPEMTEMPPMPPPTESYSMLKQLNNLAEGKMKNISMDVDHLVDLAVHSRSAQDAIEKNDVKELRFILNWLDPFEIVDPMTLDLAISKLLKRKH